MSAVCTNCLQDRVEELEAFVDGLEREADAAYPALYECRKCRTTWELNFQNQAGRWGDYKWGANAR
jgi:hypothetical protein